MLVPPRMTAVQIVIEMLNEQRAEHRAVAVEVIKIDTMPVLANGTLRGQRKKSQPLCPESEAAEAGGLCCT
jgi:hypothetical protein